MNIIGLSAFYHESACCLMADGALVAAAAEERFSRLKHDPRLPVAAFRFCLESAGLSIADLDALAYYEEPIQKLSRQLWSRLGRQHGTSNGPAGAPPGDLPWLDPSQPARAIRERLGWDGPLLTFPHHRSHAASAFFVSGFPEAAVLTVDGVGEWATTTFGRAWQPGHGPDGEDGAGIELLDEVRFPHSLGLLYSTITSYLGFRVNGGEYKVMGLAPYGAPRYLDQVRRLVSSRPSSGNLGGYTLDLTYFDFVHGERMESPALWDLFGGPPRRPGEEIDQRHRDVARSVQQVLEEVLLETVRSLHDRVPSDNLCLAGGVALNCVANGRIRREGPFRHLFVQPAAGDAGGAIGAAALACARARRARRRPASGSPTSSSDPGGALTGSPTWSRRPGSRRRTSAAGRTSWSRPSPSGSPRAGSWAGSTARWRWGRGPSAPGASWPIPGTRPCASGSTARSSAGSRSGRSRPRCSPRGRPSISTSTSRRRSCSRPAPSPRPSRSRP